ncbi:MAG: DUF1572 domain-containing protein [bacterium]|nr:DUF1572 domain-containing protein [bacterium]
MDGQHFLTDTLRELGKLEALADQATAQLPDEALFAAPDGSNNIAIMMKHMAGNMRSRWTDFLTTDGEKPDRHRDTEFVLGDDDSAANLRQRWQAGWRTTLDAIGALAPGDLEKTVTIRGEPHTVPQAILRQLSHYAYHVGQIVFLARHLAGGSWQYLSIPPGESADFDVDKDGKRYLPDEPSAS